jgi:hypothetical protein
LLTSHRELDRLLFDVDLAGEGCGVAPELRPDVTESADAVLRQALPAEEVDPLA